MSTSKLNSASRKLGQRLEDGKHHEASHQQWNRRHFLSTLGIGGGMGMMLGGFPLMTFAQSRLEQLIRKDESERILVIVRLRGGNDGLNTIVPLHDYDYYRMARPTLGIVESEMFHLNDEIAIPNVMNSLESLWKEGSMQVIRNVGYADQNLSHFTSSEIWATSTPPDAQSQTGWAGRYFDQQFPDFLANPPAVPPAILIGYASNLLFTGQNTEMGFTVSNPSEIYDIAQSGFLYDVNDVPDSYYGEQLAFVRSVSNSTAIYSEKIHEAFTNARNDVEYRGTTSNAFDTDYFTDQLAIVARLIKGRLGTKIYMVELGGFDTHEGQAELHKALMETIASGMSEFYEDLKATNQDTEVLTMTISEFGRRIEENGSLGTDHGAGAPMLLFGPSLQESNDQVVGEAPNLRSADEVGNIHYEHDFRSVYATVLQNWFCLDQAIVDDVLMGSYDRIPELGLSCTGPSLTSSRSAAPSVQLDHFVSYDQRGLPSITYELPTSAQVNLELFDASGRRITQLVAGGQAPGYYQYPIERNTLGLGFYRLEVDGTVFSGKLRLYGK